MQQLHPWESAGNFRRFSWVNGQCWGGDLGLRNSGFAHSVLLELSLDGVQVHPGPGQSYGSAV